MKVRVVFYDRVVGRFGEEQIGELSVDLEVLPRRGDQMRFHQDLAGPASLPSMALWEVVRAGFVVWPNGGTDVSLRVNRVKEQ